MLSLGQPLLQGSGQCSWCQPCRDRLHIHQSPRHKIHLQKDTQYVIVIMSRFRQHCSNNTGCCSDNEQGQTTMFKQHRYIKKNNTDSYTNNTDSYTNNTDSYTNREQSSTNPKSVTQIMLMVNNTPLILVEVSRPL